MDHLSPCYFDSKATPCTVITWTNEYPKYIDHLAYPACAEYS